MSLHKEVIEKGSIRKFFAKRRAGVHKWMKNQMNRYIRKQAKDVIVVGNFKSIYYGL